MVFLTYCSYTKSQWKILTAIIRTDLCHVFMSKQKLPQNVLITYRPLHTTCHKTVFSKSKALKSSTWSQFQTFSTEAKTNQDVYYLDAKDKDIYEILSKNMSVQNDFLTEEEEQSLIEEVERSMRKLRYESSHWDNAIHVYRETEKMSWNEKNSKIIQRVREIAFDKTISPLAHVHVLDIAKDGYIKPHVDAVRFCGDTIAGMCLLSSCVMRLGLEKDSSKFGDIYLPRRCLYIMKGRARYDFTHEVLKQEESKFKNQTVPRDRRISVICRNEPNPATRAE
ncbi:unnamed protein product [Lymnaea stagnalis]|uniref:Alpha-ketoglutarate-dependent dioxygenase AlkB-like domain-containing protein n=1 Tax=Lymnaea stagnalis TaxID=6523 RepID=A0AAV2I1W8_LYMST